VDQSDSLEIRSAMQTGKKKVQKRAIVPTELPNPEDYPLGAYPTWHAVMETMQNSPLDLMKPWVFTELLDETDALATQLFMEFTQQFWCDLRESYRKQDRLPNPQNLSEAMECWTVGTAWKSVDNIVFKPLNAGLPGACGRPMESFCSRSTMYFPLPTVGVAKDSHWRTFFEEPWYIWKYHHELSKLDEAATQALQTALEEIFAQLHCLPNSV
jgi:hypothetical protein